MSNLEQKLKDFLNTLEKEEKDLYTLSLHKIGQDWDIVVGLPEDRNHAWSVEIFKTHPRFDRSPYDREEVLMEPELLELGKVYDSYLDVQIAVMSLRLRNAVSMYEEGRGGSLKAFSCRNNPETSSPKDSLDIQWQTICGKCDYVSTWSPFIIGYCPACWKKGDKTLIPSTYLDNLTVEDGNILHRPASGWSTILGTVKPL